MQPAASFLLAALNSRRCCGTVQRAGAVAPPITCEKASEEMTNNVALDNVAHQSLRVITRYGAEFGDNTNRVMVFPTEFVAVQREYPIFFRKDANGAYQAIALLGFDQGENLYLRGGAWDAHYVPAIQQRGPFLIGIRNAPDASGGLPDATVHIDLDHPRVSQTEGEPIFLPQGGAAPALERASRALQIIYHGIELQKAMFAAFEEAGLIEPVSVEIKLHEREQYHLRNHFTISEAKLVALSGDALERLNKEGFLQAAYMVIASLGNVHRLIELRNSKQVAA